MTRPLVSADNHVSEPPGLWRERLPAEMASRGPRLETDGDYVVLRIDGVPDRKLTRIPAGADPDEMKRDIAAFGGHDPEQRRRDMETDGVVAEVIYPTFALFVDLVPDAELALACARVYNDFVAEQFFDRPDVFVPAAVVPVRDIESATAEMERVAEMGFRTAMVATTPPAGMPYNRADYDPIWSVATQAGMPVSLHTGTGALPTHERGPGGAVINYAKVGLLSAETLVYFCASGVFDRFPDLQLVFVETGAGWLAYCCERMDEAYEEHAAWVNPRLERLPSEYARSNCAVTLGADRAPLLAREVTGIEPLLWASDYPHPEGTFPESQAVVERIFAGLDEAEIRAVTYENAARLYGIDVRASRGEP